MSDIVDKMNNRNYTIKIDNNPDKLDEATLAKVNELRAKRNELTNQAEEVQKEIDKIILEANNFMGLMGKYLHITYEDSNTEIFAGPVTNIDRIYSRSCRLTVGKSLCLNNSDDHFYIELEVNDDIDISHYDSEAFGKRKTKYKEIQKEEFLNKLDEVILKFSQK